MPAHARTRTFAWYNVCGFLAAAVGSLLAGTWLGSAGRLGLDEPAAYRVMLWAYAASGVLLCAIYASAPAPPPPAPRAARAPLERSRRRVLELCGLQAIDSLAGGFIVQSLLAYWFHARFGVRTEALGTLFFATNLLSALSFLGAARIAERFGLLNTMVFTHLPSNVLLMLVPVMPTFALAAALLMARHLLSQMDVPTRQAYVVALVDPHERAAAAGYTGSARALAQALAPAISGAVMGPAAASSAPFLVAGGLKIAYDLAFFARFRRVRLEDGPRESGR